MRGLAVIREAGPADLARVEGLLSRQIDMAMFPLANLRAQGLGQDGFPSDHPHASRFWLLPDAGLVALSRGGMLMPLFGDACDPAPLRAVLRGQRVEGALGPARAVRTLLSALGLTAEPSRKDEDEPAFALDLASLSIPVRPGAALVPAADAHRPLLLAWREAYHTESLGTPAEEARTLAKADVDRMIDRGNHRLLLADGQPVALTGFNAALPDIVQVGGVYTPPALRGRGHARLAVALHLAEARAAGVARAVLFAASPAAARAYRAIGFQPNGSFALVLFAAPATISA
jgi:RimJ/RimL family protein N-acetyltransferase